MKCLQVSSHVTELNCDIGGIAGDDGGLGGDASVPAADVVVGVDGAGPPDVGAAASSPAADVVAGVDEENVYQLPTVISGCAVGYEFHRHSNSMGLRVKCNRHVNCRRFHSLAKDEYGIGIRAAEAWLGAWLQLPESSAKPHSQWVPSKEQVLAFRESMLWKV